MSQDLTTLREQISTLDAGILALLDERMRLAVKIGEYKQDNKIEVLDSNREQSLLQQLIKKNETTIIPDEKLLEIWGKILETSRGIQKKGD